MSDRCKLVRAIFRSSLVWVSNFTKSNSIFYSNIVGRIILFENEMDLAQSVN